MNVKKMKTLFLSLIMVVASTCALFAQVRVLDNGTSQVTVCDDEVDWRNDPEITIEVVKNMMLKEVNPNFKANILGPVYDEIAREHLHKMYKQHPEAVDAAMDMAESGCLMGMTMYYPEWDTIYVVLLVKCWDGWLIMWRRA